MIKHIILYKFKENITEDIVTKIMEKFNLCKQEVDGLISIESGENSSLKVHLSGGYNYGIVMTFNDENDIKKYNEAKAHKQAKEIMDEYLESKIIFDIEC